VTITARALKVPLAVSSATDRSPQSLADGRAGTLPVEQGRPAIDRNGVFLGGKVLQLGSEAVRPEKKFHRLAPIAKIGGQGIRARDIVLAGRRAGDRPVTAHTIGVELLQLDLGANFFQAPLKRPATAQAKLQDFRIGIQVNLVARRLCDQRRARRKVNPTGALVVGQAECRRSLEFLFAHVLIRKPGFRPGSSPGQAFSGACASRSEPACPSCPCP
jgi:hypothetical protein